MIWLVALIAILLGGFVFTQGGEIAGPVLVGLGTVIILIKVLA